MKQIWLDTETTGTDPRRNDIWQLAFILMDGKKEVHRGKINCKPFCPWETDPEALRVGGLGPIESNPFDGFMKPHHAVDRFKFDLQKLIDPYNKNDKAVIGGYNVNFDLQFLSWWFKKANDKYGLGSYTDYSTLDAFPLIKLLRREQFVPLADTKLQTVCNHYHIPLVNAHDALADTEAAMRVYPFVLSDFQSYLNIHGIEYSYLNTHGTEY